MQFYSGFSLKDDKKFFLDFTDEGEYCICGFSYGAIKAFSKVKELLYNSKRVDKLQLFSPAFFQTTQDSFKKLQLKGYKRDKELYLTNFIKSCFYPYSIVNIENHIGTEDELEELLFYRWSIDELLQIKNKGVKVEVYLGGRDKIIDAHAAYNFFIDVADVTFIKEANHFLQIK